MFQIKFQIESFNYIPKQYLNGVDKWIYKTALYYAIEDRNYELIELLLTNENLDINIFNILYLILSIQFQVKLFSEI